jgi:hypothetical protein
MPNHASTINKRTRFQDIFPNAHQPTLTQWCVGNGSLTKKKKNLGLSNGENLFPGISKYSGWKLIKDGTFIYSIPRFIPVVMCGDKKTKGVVYRQ